jgi:hypothetical protein
MSHRKNGKNSPDAKLVLHMVEEGSTDSEEWDEERLRIARTVLKGYCRISGVEREGAISNLLTDLMLLCLSKPKWGDFDDAHEQACRDFDFETWGD